MLLPLLGACAVVGPFQGPEWEPVRGLISRDCSCRDPRCCGNLLVLCLFLIWQVRHYWHQFTRTRLRGRNVIRVRGPLTLPLSFSQHHHCHSHLLQGPCHRPCVPEMSSLDWLEQASSRPQHRSYSRLLSFPRPTH